jgi:hypothetical protein
MHWRAATQVSSICAEHIAAAPVTVKLSLAGALRLVADSTKKQAYRYLSVIHRLRCCKEERSGPMLLIREVSIRTLNRSLTQASGTITNGTQSTAQPANQVNVNVGTGGSGLAGVANTQQVPAQSEIGYTGSYTVKSAPTVYAPSLTASVTETCWGSVSAAVSVVGVGATGAATIKDQDCNRRLNAAVSWRMDRKDIAFNIMCQDDSFRAAAAAHG